MKKLSKEYKEIIFHFITPKQIMFYINIIIMLSSLTSTNSLNIQNSSKILKFKLNGDIIISAPETGNIINNNKLNAQLIYTKINEKNVNFLDNNILPTKNGEITYIDPYQHITLLDISLEEFFINSPIIIKKYPDFLFISNRTMNLFAININNGEIYNIDYYDKNSLNKNEFKYIKEICPRNENDVLFLRIDYYLQLKYSCINNNIKDIFNDLISYSHYIKILPLYPNVNIEKNNNLKNFNFENDDYYIFEIKNNNINVIYSQDKYFFMQAKDIQNEYNFENYYFGNNKRKYLFEYNINKEEEKKINLSFKFLKKFFLLIIIFVLSVLSFKIYKSNFIKNNYLNIIKKDDKNKIPLKINIINNEDKIDNINNNIINIEQNPKLSEEKPISPKLKSISNLSTNCSIDKENKQKEKKDEKIRAFTSSKRNLLPPKKKDFMKYPVSSKSSLQLKKRASHKRTQSIKQLIKNAKISSEEEKKQLNSLFATYINDVTKNTSDSEANLLNFNLSENEDKYKKIFSLIKSEDSSSSDEINLKYKNQGFFAGELENNFLFYFDNGRLLNNYKDFEFIGKGGFGVVFKATNKIDESQCAIKVMKINLDLKEENEDLKVIQEIKTMLKFKKKNIVRYKTCWFEFNQKRIKKKRERAMSLEQENTPTINFKNNFLEEGEKKIKNNLKKHLKTPLERIQSISKELKLAQSDEQKIKANSRKKSVIWDSDEDSDADSLGANKNYAIKEEGEDKYINLDDKESEENSQNINEENSNSNDNNKEESESENDEKNNIDENNNDNEENSSENENREDNNNIYKRKRIIEMSSNSNSKENTKNNNKDDSEYNNLRNKNYDDELSSKNKDNSSNDINFINPERDSENNSIFEEEIKKEKEEQKLQNYEYDENLDDDDDEYSNDDDDIKNNSEDGLGISSQKKKRKKKKYPIYFFIQMEYCSGCPMNYYLSHRTCVPSRKLTSYMLYQMVKAVKHIHEGNIIHRDLKPGNIFIIDDYLIKIGDFGLALNSNLTQSKQGGTYLYQSPEQIENKSYDEKIDIFALGVILVELVSKFNTEFERREILQGLKKSVYPEYLKEDHLKEYNLVKKMTALDPKDRPNIKEILKDNDFVDLIKESLNAD